MRFSFWRVIINIKILLKKFKISYRIFVTFNLTTLYFTTNHKQSCSSSLNLSEWYIKNNFHSAPVPPHISYQPEEDWLYSGPGLGSE